MASVYTHPGLPSSTPGPRRPCSLSAVAFRVSRARAHSLEPGAFLLPVSPPRRCPSRPRAATGGHVCPCQGSATRHRDGAESQGPWLDSEGWWQEAGAGTVSWWGVRQVSDLSEAGVGFPEPGPWDATSLCWVSARGLARRWDGGCRHSRVSLCM